MVNNNISLQYKFGFVETVLLALVKIKTKLNL